MENIRILGLGDNTVDRYIDYGLFYPGGNALNVAVSSKRAGAFAGYLGCIGSDYYGNAILSSVRNEEIDLKRLRIYEGVNATCDIKIEGTERIFISSTQAKIKIILDKEDFEYISTFNIVHTGDNSHIEDQIAEISNFSKISFDFSNRRNIKYLEFILPNIDVAFFSSSDFDQKEAEEFLKWVISKGPKLSVTTRGKNSTIMFNGEDFFYQEPFLANIVDTLGAGDSFIGRFLVGFLANNDPVVILKDAAHSAARTCEHYGGFGYPYTMLPSV